MIFPAGDTVTRERPLGVDDDGDPIEGTPERIEIEDCAVAPRLADETAERGRFGVVIGVTLLAPYGSDIIHGDIIEIDEGPSAGRWEVEGEPGSWKQPWSGWEAGMELSLRRAEG